MKIVVCCSMKELDMVKNYIEGHPIFENCEIDYPRKICYGETLSSIKLEWFIRIETADLVLFFTKLSDGTIGESTAAELAYAKRVGKQYVIIGNEHPFYEEVMNRE